MTKRPDKIRVTLDFAHAGFLEIYQKIAKAKGLPLGQVAAIELEHNIRLYAEGYFRSDIEKIIPKRVLDKYTNSKAADYF